MNDLKPCPFCGHTESTVRPVWKYWSVGCNNCAMGGPVRDTPEEAEDAWNERYQLTCRNGQIDFWGEDYDENDGFECTHCGYLNEAMGEPDFCPECGAKVIKP